MHQDSYLVEGTSEALSEMPVEYTDDEDAMKFTQPPTIDGYVVDVQNSRPAYNFMGTPIVDNGSGNAKDGRDFENAL